MSARTNVENVDFTVAAGAVPTHFVVWLRGVAKAIGVVSNAPAALMADQFYRFPPGTLRIEVPEGDFTASGAADAVDSVLSAETQVSLHTGAPGVDGSDNEATSAGDRTVVRANGWAVA